MTSKRDMRTSSSEGVFMKCLEENIYSSKRAIFLGLPNDVTLTIYNVSVQGWVRILSAMYPGLDSQIFR